MLLNEAITHMVSYIAGVIDEGQLGTAGTLTDPTDTGLGNAVPATLASATTEISDNQITINFNKLSTVATAITFREYEVRDGTNSVDWTRFVFTGQTALTTDDWNIKVRLFVKRI